jgi:hypothetical protein
MGLGRMNNASGPVPPCRMVFVGRSAEAHQPSDQSDRLLGVFTDEREKHSDISNYSRAHLIFFHSELYTNSQLELLSPIMSELIRDAPLGQFLRRITGNSILLHPEERPDFDYSPVTLKSEDRDSGNGSEQPFTTVTWYSTDDKANPQNWTLGKKCFVHFLICLLTFASK